MWQTIFFRIPPRPKDSFHLLPPHHMITRSSRRHAKHVILLYARGLALANHAPWQNEGPTTIHAGCSSQPTSHLLRSSIDLGDPRPSTLIPSLHSPPLRHPTAAMDLAYDHIQEEALNQEAIEKGEQKNPESTLNDDFQEAYRAISSSPWGAKLGGFFGSVVKQV